MIRLATAAARRLSPRICRVSRQWLRDRSGSSIIELALIIACVGAPLMLGTAQVGFLVYDSIEISNAAHAGAMFGMMSNANANNSTAITTAAQTEASDFGTNLSVTPTVYWACSTAESGAQYTTSAAATTACTGSGNHPLEFVQVVVSTSATPPIHFPGLPASYTLGSTSVMEVEE